MYSDWYRKDGQGLRGHILVGSTSRGGHVAFFLLGMCLCINAMAGAGSGDSPIGTLDTVPPRLDSIWTPSLSSIHVVFSEPMLKPEVLSPTSYYLFGAGAGSASILPDLVFGTGPYTLSWITGEMVPGEEIMVVVSSLQDAVGNPIDPGTPEDHVASAIVSDAAPVFWDVTADPPQAAVGDLMTITFTSSEPLDGLPTVTVNGNAATFTGSTDGMTFTYQYLILDIDPLGSATIEVSGLDFVGQLGSASETTALEIVEPTPLGWWPVVAAFVLAGALLVALRRRKRSALLILLLLASPWALAAGPIVSDVAFVQHSNGAGGTQVVISYDLYSNEGLCDITVTLSKDGGQDGFPFAVTSVTGDLTDIGTGTDKQIIWDIAADYPNENISQARLRVTAETQIEADYSDWEAPYPAWIWAYLQSCENNLKRWGLIFNMFANEQRGEVYPRLSDTGGLLMIRKDDVYPEYCSDMRMLRCPGRVDDAEDNIWDDDHYVYLGYLLTCDADVVAFAGAYANEIMAGGDFSDNLPGPTAYAGSIYRLREGVEAVLVDDPSDEGQLAAARATIPVMFDWPDNHQEGWGGNVLYLDGHVEFQPYPGEFPMTEATISILANLAGYTPPTEWRTPYDTPYWPTQDPYGFVTRCHNHLVSMSLLCRAFANENHMEKWPPLSSEGGRLMMDADSIYPEYLTNPAVALCPGVPEGSPPPHLDDRDYVYFGYVLTNDEDAQAFATAYQDQVAAGGDFTADLPGSSSYGTKFYRLREGIERFLITDINNPPEVVISRSHIPVIMEWPDNHENLTGGHVLYMDGHTEWLDYPGDFPMSETTVSVFAGLAGRVSKTDWADPEPVYLPENDPYRFAAQCGNNCAKIGAAFKIFARDDQNNGFFPMLSDEPGRLMFRHEDMYPDYLTNPGTLVCPGPEEQDPEPYFDDTHYVYLGYLLTCDEDVTGFANAYADEMAGDRDFSGNLPGTVSYGEGDTIYRLREGVERFLITDINNPPAVVIAASHIPVLIEWPDHHEGFSGGHVLYFDGHVEWKEYPGEWPMTEATIGTLDALAHWPKTTAWASRDFSWTDDPYNQALCQHNMLCLVNGMLFFDYHYGTFPALSNVASTLMYTASEMDPYFLDNTVRLNCPGSISAFAAPAIDDQSYAYLGYMVLNEADLQAFANAYSAEIAGGGDFSSDLPASASYGEGDTLYRLRSGVDRLAIEDINNPAASYVGLHEIPVLIEWPDNHGPLRGGNVTYLDGHTEWLAYPSEFPMTEAAMQILTTLAGRPDIE